MVKLVFATNGPGMTMRASGTLTAVARLGRASLKPKQTLLSDGRGYALVAVLVFSMLISALALAAMTGALSLSHESRILRQDTELRALLEAGANRAIAAYSRPNDELRSTLVPDGRPVLWQFDNQALILSVEAESGKWDLNAGALAQIKELLGLLIKEPGLRSEIERKLVELRGTGQIQSVASVLRPFDRMTSRQDVFDRHFTVMTDQRGIDLSTAPPLSVQAYQGLPDAWKKKLLDSRQQQERIDLSDFPSSISEALFHERPIYTFRASTGPAFGRIASLSALVQFGEGGKMHLFSWRMSGKTM